MLKRTEHCNLSLDELFDHKSFNEIGKNRDDVPKTIDRDFEHVHPDKKFQFLVYEFEGAFDISKLDRIFGFLLWEKPDDIEIIRCKGLIHGHQSDLKYSLQG